ncbi:site-specific integrase [Delftia acidovorans]|uniref:site-specific integrase n=1 Tax=Delftia acidovorans TaxID=80866 RepID=UPI00242AF24E|nr:site-specific integrase [Delftia acidovorans]
MPGVIVRDKYLQIDLRAHGFGRERLELQPTPANIRYAERMRAEILGKIERGTFALSEYFPDSPRARVDVPSMTVGQLFGEWLDVKKPELQHSTVHSYQQTIDSYHFDGVRKELVGDFNFRALKRLLARLPANPKTFNNVASVLRQVLEYGHKAKILAEPLHESIEMRRRQKPEPDPFTLDEVEVLLGKMKAEAARNYFEFAFFSGLRPSELIALTWSKVDLRSGTVMVDSALTRGRVKGTKTSEIRKVELPGRARDALERQRTVSQLAGGRVFLTVAGGELENTDIPLDSWWKPALKVSGIRHRDARQTRHTYATMMLMAGVTPAYAARQMGHGIEMFLRTYSKWIDGADKGAEQRKLDSFISASKPKAGTQTGT